MVVRQREAKEAATAAWWLLWAASGLPELRKRRGKRGSSCGQSRPVVRGAGQRTTVLSRLNPSLSLTDFMCVCWRWRGKPVAEMKWPAGKERGEAGLPFLSLSHLNFLVAE
ncbi:hypothetical protein Acr_26g0001440 [Actinidia rufa]|uniref:Uncharacterized protein n=1 Tax=Actinidia rufa TaxID=165716 RepID=A0A7J0H258_9ERIC|nr:hypothetical protein Acr_26g0001440 [Actinidia rufa]